MSAAQLTILALLAALTGYALLGGADFGGGFWDLAAGAGTGQRAAERRRLIEHALGPVWEANHVWLIFAIVLLWTGFPSVFAAIASTAYIPLTAAALGVIGRGSGFAFRKVSTEYRYQRLFGAVFAFSSLATPFFLGAVLGSVAAGRIPAGIASGGRLASWWSPTSIMAGVLAVGIGAHLAAVFLTGDAQREAPHLVPVLRRDALIAGVAVGGLAVAGLLVIRLDAPELARSLWRAPALVLVLTSMAAGLTSLVLLAARRYLAVRITAGLAAATVIWAWVAASYPTLLPGVTVGSAAADPAVLHALLGACAVGAVVLVPSLGLLFAIFQRRPNSASSSDEHITQP
jgi:cytochrome d ubiquinol oxidase subunit II